MMNTGLEKSKTFINNEKQRSSANDLTRLREKLNSF
jgi:hypothetical protein